MDRKATVPAALEAGERSGARAIDASRRRSASHRLARAARGLVAAAAVLLAFGSPAEARRPAPGPAARPDYRVLYTTWIKAGNPVATVRIRLASHPEWVRWMRLRADPTRYRDFKASGRLEFGDGQVTWIPPRRDAWLQFRVNLESQRDVGRYDGRMTESWALFRADDLVPPVHLDMQDGTQSKAKLTLLVPEGWSVVTPFPRYASGRFRIDNPNRLFDRPTGWILLGRLGVRRETIGGTRLTIAGPTGQGVRRLDMLAFFRFTLPTLQKLFPDLPERLLVVSAGDPMWRGALSGPGSLFVHAERPLISENATSTFIHELVHVAMRARGGEGADWIVEGLAEYYSLEILRRSGAIAERRYQKTHARLAEWAKQAGPLEVERAQGAVTAKAVGILRAVDEEIRVRTERRASLDDVVRRLSRNEAVTTEAFRAAVEQVAGGPVRSLPAPAAGKATPPASPATESAASSALPPTAPAPGPASSD
ncbi:MAG: hypothetical protein U0900_13385 [Myxococcota bacterium]